MDGDDQTPPVDVRQHRDWIAHVESSNVKQAGPFQKCPASGAMPSSLRPGLQV
jgi:hypothetical protein